MTGSPWLQTAHRPDGMLLLSALGAFRYPRSRTPFVPEHAVQTAAYRVRNTALMPCHWYRVHDLPSYILLDLRRVPAMSKPLCEEFQKCNSSPTLLRIIRMRMRYSQRFP